MSSTNSTNNTNHTNDTFCGNSNMSREDFKMFLGNARIRKADSKEYGPDTSSEECTKEKSNIYVDEDDDTDVDDDNLLEYVMNNMSGFSHHMDINGEQYVRLLYKNNKKYLCVNISSFKKLFDAIGVTPDGKYFISSTIFKTTLCFEELDLCKGLFSEIDLQRLRSRKHNINAIKGTQHENKYCVMFGGNVLKACDTYAEAKQKSEEMSSLDTFILCPSKGNLEDI